MPFAVVQNWRSCCVRIDEGKSRCPEQGRAQSMRGTRIATAPHGQKRHSATSKDHSRACHASRFRLQSRYLLAASAEPVLETGGGGPAVSREGNHVHGHIAPDPSAMHSTVAALLDLFSEGKIVEVVGTLSSAIGMVRQVVDLADAVKNAEIKAAAAETLVQLAEVKMRLAELIDENAQLKAQLKAKDDKPTVKVKDDAYYTTEGDGPFCTACYDAHGKLSRVSAAPRLFKSIARWICPVCKAHFGK